MDSERKDDFVGRHLIVDASTYTRRNLTSTDILFALFESLNRSLDMTAVLPPIVCRYPFANDELSSFCDAIEAELAAKSEEVGNLSLTPVRVMREFLRRRQTEESGVTGVSIWAESHAAIHTWDEDNYFAFDAFSCRDFRPQDALRLLMTNFDVDMLNCVNLFRYQRSIPRVSNFQVSSSWDVIVEGRVIGELDVVDFSTICPGGPESPRIPVAEALSSVSSAGVSARDGAAARHGARRATRPGGAPRKPRRRSNSRAT